MTAHNRVILENHFPAYILRVREGARVAIEGAGRVMADEAAASAHVLTGALRASESEAVIAHGYGLGLYAILHPLFYARFFEFGTLGRRRRKLKQPQRRRRDAAAGSGIKAEYTLRKAVRVGQAALLAAVKGLL